MLDRAVVFRSSQGLGAVYRELAIMVIKNLTSIENKTHKYKTT